MQRIKQIKFFIIILHFILISCYHHYFNNPFHQTRWLLTQYAITNINSPISTHDTLTFGTEPTMYFNQMAMQYQVLDAGSPGYILRLRMTGTPWGNISGILQESTVENGMISGAEFVEEISQTHYYLWLEKIE